MEKISIYFTIGTIPIFILSIKLQKLHHSVWKEVWIHKTSLTPPPFIEVPVPSQESEQSWFWVLGVSILLLSTTFPLDFRTVLTVWYLFIVFPFIECMKKWHTTLKVENTALWMLFENVTYCFKCDGHAPNISLKRLKYEIVAYSLSKNTHHWLLYSLKLHAIWPIVSY